MLHLFGPRGFRGPFLSVVYFTSSIFTVGIDEAFADNLHWYTSSINIPTIVTSSPAAPPVVIAIVDDAFNIDDFDVKPFLRTDSLDIPNNGLDDDGNGHIDDSESWDVADGDANVRSPAERIDEFYHGTTLTRIIIRILRSAMAAEASDHVKILPVKAVSDFDQGAELKEAYAGIKYALDAGADIILTAWSNDQISRAERDLLRAAENQGVLIVAAAGNERIEKITYPAAHPSVLTVAATNANNLFYSVSNHGTFVDLSAPGHEITEFGYLKSRSATASGTSASAAMVAAAAALVKVRYPELSHHEVAACLVNHTQEHRFEKIGKHGKFGSGILNVSDAADCSSIVAKPERVSSTKRLSAPDGYLDLNGPETRWEFELKPYHEGIKFTYFTDSGPDSQGELELIHGNDISEKIVLAASQQTFNVSSELSAIEFMPAGSNLNYSLLKYEVITAHWTKQHCDGTQIIDTEQIISDGSNHASYTYYSDCKWLIYAPEGKVIEFEVLELATEPKIDKIVFFDGERTHENIFAELSGTKIPPVFRSWRNKALIWFLSDEENEFDGWKIDFRFVD